MPAPKGNKFALNNKGGRPTKVTPDLIERCQIYLEQCKDDLANKKVNLPGVEGLARWLNISRDTVHAWKSENKEFSDIVDDIKAEQAKRLLDNGLAGTYNSVIAKLILSSNHNMREKTDVTTDDKQIQGVVILPQKNNADTLATTSEAIPGTSE